MNEKTICIGIISMFLLTGLTTVSAVEIKTSQRVVLEKMIYGNKDTTDMGDEKWALIVDLFDLEESNGIIYLFSQKGWDMENIRRTTGSDMIDSFKWIIDHSDSSDSVFIYIGAHGNDISFGNNGYRMTWEELGNYVDNITAAKIALWISTCYSGAAIPFLQKDNRIIGTVCKSDELSHSNSRLIYALQGYADYEGNYDGYVSMEEAFNYYYNDQIYPDSDQTPQIVDDVTGEFLLVNVDKVYIDSEHIDIYNLHPIHGMNGIGYDLIFAQSFIPNYEKITKIRLLLAYKYNTDVLGDLIIYIRKERDGDNLATVKASPESLAEDRFFDVYLPDISFTPRETYWMIFTSEPQKYFGVLVCTEQGYANGECYFWNGEWNIEHEGEDILFITYIDEINNPPDQPSQPNGPSSGRSNTEYIYSTSAADIDDDQLYYLFDWGDGSNSGWLGPYTSGCIVEVSHSWSRKGTYAVKVIAKDIHERQSSWSEPLNVDLPKNKPLIYKQFLHFLQGNLHIFLLLQRLLNL